jgi:hypothetical protein
MSECHKFTWCVMGPSHRGECSSILYTLAKCEDCGSERVKWPCEICATLDKERK